MSDPTKRLSEEVRGKLKKAKQPSWTNPMLATLSDDHFSDEDWIYESKFDGERVLAFKDGSELRLMSRNHKELNETYTELVDAVTAQQPNSFIVDGEVIAFEGNVTSFERLQRRIQIKDGNKVRNSGVAVYYYLFDTLHYDGYDTTGLPQRERKKLLRAALKFKDPLRFTCIAILRGKIITIRPAVRAGKGSLPKTRTPPTCIPELAGG